MNMQNLPRTGGRLNDLVLWDMRNLMVEAGSKLVYEVIQAARQTSSGKTGELLQKKQPCRNSPSD